VKIAQLFKLLKGLESDTDSMAISQIYFWNQIQLRMKIEVEEACKKQSRVKT
jgi:hypothetical protein